MILMIMSLMPEVGETSVYASRRLKKFSMRENRSTSTAWLALTSFAA